MRIKYTNVFIYILWLQLRSDVTTVNVGKFKYFRTTVTKLHSRKSSEQIKSWERTLQFISEAFVSYQRLQRLKYTELQFYLSFCICVPTEVTQIDGVWEQDAEEVPWPRRGTMGLNPLPPITKAVISGWSCRAPRVDITKYIFFCTVLDLIVAKIVYRFLNFISCWTEISATYDSFIAHW
jgi:hypothetical protein